MTAIPENSVLLDTTVLRDLISENNTKLKQNVIANVGIVRHVYISIITTHELEYRTIGMDEGKNKRERATAVANMMNRFKSLEVNAEIASKAARLRHDKHKQGKDADKLMLDMFIAATALHHNMLLFTSDKDFKGIKSLPTFNPRQTPKSDPLISEQ